MNKYGNGKANKIKGTEQKDYIEGRGGNDWLWGYAGNDQLMGGAGHDSLIGGAGNDWLNGGAGHDYIDGDDLDANGGDDTIIGGLGGDTMIGRGGRDTFVFRSVADFGYDPGIDRPDVIGDFEVGLDKIDLRQIDANTRVAGNQAFEFVGRFTGRGGELELNRDPDGMYRVTGDIDGDKYADFSLWVFMDRPTMELWLTDFLF